MAKQKSDVASKAAEKPSFEKALAELEEIVGRMESGKLGLEEMIAQFEKGQALVKFCAGKLNEVERKIEVLVKKGDKVIAEPFEPAEDGGGEDGAESGGKGDGKELF